MEDYAGDDALVLTLDFTNNSEETTDCFWAIYETAMHNGTGGWTWALSMSTLETLESVDDSQYQNVDPGVTVEIQTAFELDEYHRRGRSDVRGEVRQQKRLHHH